MIVAYQKTIGAEGCSLPDAISRLWQDAGARDFSVTKPGYLGGTRGCIDAVFKDEETQNAHARCCPMDRLMDILPARPQPPIIRYGATALIIAVCFLIVLGLRPREGAGHAIPAGGAGQSAGPPMSP